MIGRVQSGDTGADYGDARRAPATPAQADSSGDAARVKAPAPAAFSIARRDSDRAAISSISSLGGRPDCAEYEAMRIARATERNKGVRAARAKRPMM